MNKNAFALALLVIMLASSLSNCNLVLAETYTNIDQGPISSDTTWTKADSPYILLGKVTVSNKAKLTIEPGVIVGGGVLQVDDGILIAQGSVDQKVYFKNSLILDPKNPTLYKNGVTLNFKNSTIDNAVLVNDLTIVSGSPVISNSYIKGGLTLKGGSPLINSNIIDTRVIVIDGSPTISNSIISDGIHADAKGGPLKISNNQITSKSGFTVIYIQGIHADITGNKIVGNKEKGISSTQYLVTSTSAYIADNQVSKCTTGIYFGTYHNVVSVIRNVIFNNDKGLDFYGPGIVENNTIVQNRIGVRASKVSVFSQNNLQNNSELNLENMWFPDMDATNNWWGTADAQSINQTIIGERAQVFFVPFLSEPNPNAPQIPENNPIIIPTVPPEPTATPTPATTAPNDTNSVGHPTELFPTVIVIAVLATITIIACTGAFAYLKRRK